MPISIILASSSPRRKDLLEQIGLTFTIVPTDIDEHALPDEVPADHVLRLAREKAQKATRSCSEGIIIAADTIVVLDGEILGKPTDPQNAAFLLERLSGRDHNVITGLAVLDAKTGDIRTGLSITQVWFRHLTPYEITAYVNTREPIDKAGAYGIQGKGALFIEKVNGCYFNVVGLPLSLLHSLLVKFGVPVL